MRFEWAVPESASRRRAQARREARDLPEMTSCEISALLSLWSSSRFICAWSDESCRPTTSDDQSVSGRCGPSGESERARGRREGGEWRTSKNMLSAVGSVCVVWCGWSESEGGGRESFGVESLALIRFCLRLFGFVRGSNDPLAQKPAADRPPDACTQQPATEPTLTTSSHRALASTFAAKRSRAGCVGLVPRVFGPGLGVSIWSAGAVRLSTKPDSTAHSSCARPVQRTSSALGPVQRETRHSQRLNNAM